MNEDDITFKSTQNEFAENTELDKTYFLAGDHILERKERTEII